jgi:hypothetical protein
LERAFGENLDYNKVGEVKTAGNSSALKSYSFTDKSVGFERSDLFYYRLPFSGHPNSLPANIRSCHNRLSSPPTNADSPKIFSIQLSNSRAKTNPRRYGNRRKPGSVKNPLAICALVVFATGGCSRDHIKSWLTICR